jgi:hypothetical protein
MLQVRRLFNHIAKNYKFHMLGDLRLFASEKSIEVLE